MLKSKKESPYCKPMVCLYVSSSRKILEHSFSSLNSRCLLSYIMLCAFKHPIPIFNLFSCTGQTSTLLSRARLGRVELGLGNGGHKEEVSVFAVPTCACSPTLLPGSTIYRTHTGELERWGRGSAMVPVGLRSKSMLTHQPTLPLGEKPSLLNSV